MEEPAEFDLSVPRVTEFDGLEQAGPAFVELLAGGTVGTTIVRIAH